MKPNGANISLTPYDDIFSTEETRNNGPNEQIREIPLSELFPFKDHPFSVMDDKKMMDMVESVKEFGVMIPIIARPLDGGGYEIVSGHRRKRACELAGIKTIPVLVRDLDNDEATILMVDSNLQQRDDIPPTERAKAYQMKMDALRHQGERTDLSSRHDGKKWSVEKIAEESGDSERQVHRYLRLNNLNPELQEMVDEGRLALTPAVELSYLKPDEQRDVAVALEETQNTPSLSQAQRIRKMSESGEATREKLTDKKSKEERNMLKKVFAVILVISLMAFSTAIASESGFFGELAQVEYADERLPALEKVAERVPASSLTKNGITVELGQGYYEGNRVFISFKISANTDLIELYEGAPDAGIKWNDSMENMIIGEEPANSADVKKQYDWLDGKSQHWARVPSCSTGDGLELDDGTYLDIVAGYQKEQVDGTILGWKECIIPEGKELDSLTFKVPFCWYTMIRFQDYTTYKETVESSENDSINFTLNRNNSFQYLQGASQVASYQATAQLAMGNVDIKGTIRIVSPEQAASWIAWQEGEEETGTDVISCWNLYQNGELVSADLYGASEIIGTDEVVFEVMFPHMDDINGLILVPEYSEGGEKQDEAIALEFVIQ